MAKAYRVNIKSEAHSDLDAVYAYILNDSPQNARKMLGKLKHAIQCLRSMPTRNVIRQHRKDPSLSVRAEISWPYLIYYRVNEGLTTVTILTVRHGARRQPKRFK
jgi:plasmid stabilization system protein ParE